MNLSEQIQKTLGAVSEDKVAQNGPASQGEFVYVDIGSIDIERKRIVEPTALPAEKAPSRAKQNLKAGGVLVSMTRPNRNAVALVPKELDGAIGSTGFHVLRPRGVDSSWLFHAVQTNNFVDAMGRLVQGALYPAVRPKDIRNYAVSIPSCDEQRQIVAEIEKGKFWSVLSSSPTAVMIIRPLCLAKSANIANAGPRNWNNTWIG